MELIILVLLCAGRAAPIAWMLPVLGGATVPPTLRMGFALALALLAMPRVTGVPVMELPGPVLALLMVREIAVGFTLGFLASLPFRAAEMAGRMGDTLRGANMAEVLAPLSGERSSPLGALFYLLATVIFLEMGGLVHLSSSLARSYEAIPVATLALQPGLAKLAAYLVAATAGLLEAAIGLAAPVLVAMLLADLGLAMIARAAPQVPVFFLGMPLKALGGIGVVLLSLGALRTAIEGTFGDMARWLAGGIAIWR